MKDQTKSKSGSFGAAIYVWSNTLTGESVAPAGFRSRLFTKTNSLSHICQSNEVEKVHMGSEGFQ